jgi:hypothetical protein
MAVYRVVLEGREKPVLLRAKNKSEALDMVVDARALTGEEVEEALVGGEKLWKVGDPFPADEVSVEAGEA